MRKLNAPAAMLISAALALSAIPAAADAKPVRTHKVWVCKNPRDAANTGTVVGAIGGALVGNAIAGDGNKTGGTLIGAGVGGLTGRQIAKQNAKHKCHYEYRRY